MLKLRDRVSVRVGLLLHGTFILKMQCGKKRVLLPAMACKLGMMAEKILMPSAFHKLEATWRKPSRQSGKVACGDENVVLARLPRNSPDNRES